MLADINTKAIAREKQSPTHVTFEEFLAMYANYRPVSGVGKVSIRL